MKKITLLLLLILPFLGFGQTTIASYTFDTTVDGWLAGASASIANNSANYYTSVGSLELTTTDINKVAKSSGIPITETGEYTVSFKVKGGPAAAKVKGIINQGSNNAGPVITITSLTSSTGSDTTTWYEYSYTWTITSLANIQIQIQGSDIGTYYIDDVTLVKEACVGSAVTTANDGGGTATITTFMPCYASGTNVEVTPTPSCGDFTFSEWEIDVNGTITNSTDNPLIYAVTSDTDIIEIKALFTASATAPDTNFDTDAELSNWNATSNSTVSVSGDDLTWTISGGSPKIKYDACSFAPETWNITHLKIGYSNETANTRLRLVHPKDVGLAYTNFDGLATGDDVTPGVGVIDVALTHGTWIDFLSSMEFFIKLNSSNGDAVNGDFVIDYIEFYDSTIGLITTSGIGSSWNDTTTWTGGLIPGSSSDVQIDHAVTINNDEVAANVTVTSAGALAFNNGSSLTLSGNLVNEDDVANSLVIRNSSTAFSSLIVEGTVTGNVRHRRHINANPQNDLISPAVLVPFNAFYTEIGDRIHTYGDGGIAFGPFDSSAGTYTQYTPTTTTDLIPGTGYVAGASGTPDQNFNFHGTVRTDQVDVTISGAGASTWNLIGNPYPSYVNFDTFHGQLVTDAVLEIGYVAIYGWNGTAWTVWDSANGKKIAPGQGFYVRSNATGGDVSFTPIMRTTGTAITDDDFIAGRVANTNSVKASFNLLKNAINYPTNIIFTDGKTRSLDYGGDTAAFSGPGSSATNIYTNLVEDNNGLELYNQALPYNDFNDVVVPLGVEANLGEQISIGLDAVSTTIPTNINVYLEDNVTNTWTLLNTGDYTFTPSVVLSGTGRFFVHFSSTTLSTDDNSYNGLQIYSPQATKTVVVKGQLTSDTNISIFDIRGRRLLQQNLNSTNTINSVDVNNLSTGVYIVQLNNQTQNKVQKIIIK